MEIREVKEGTGIEVAFSDLISLGILDYVAVKLDFFDKEIAHVYVHKYNNKVVGRADFVPQNDAFYKFVVDKIKGFLEN